MDSDGWYPRVDDGVKAEHIVASRKNSVETISSFFRNKDWNFLRTGVDSLSSLV